MPESRKDRSSIAGAAWRLGRDLVVRPSRAVERLRQDAGALPASAALYLVYLLAGVAFYAWKPVDFPSSDSAGPLGRGGLGQGPLFWAEVQAWNPLLTAIWLYFLAWFLGRLKKGRLAFWLFVSALVWVLPMIGFVAWATTARKLALAGAWAVALAATLPGVRERTRDSWRRLAAFLMAVTALNLALLPLYIAAVATGAGNLYEGLEMATLLWTLGLGAYVVSRLEELPTARAFAAILYSMIAQMIAVFSLHAAGIVSKDILKALMSV